MSRIVSRFLQIARTPQLPLRRRSSTGPVNPVIKRKQEKYQADDGVPVHLKGGVVDQILYRGTLGLCILSIGLYINLVYNLAYSKKK